MSNIDDDQDWLGIDEHGDELTEWILIEHDWLLEEEGDYCDNYSSEDEDEDDEDDQEEDDGLFFLEEEEEEERRKEFLQEVIKQQVLPHLPAKSLLRLKSTSRQWRSYISSPLFIHTHSQLRRSLTGMFFHTPSGIPSFAAFDGDPRPLPDPSLSFLPEPVGVRASAGGLLCCRGRWSDSYYVCNPMTSEWTALPPPPGCHGPDPAVAIVMREPSAYNFRADYHVVCAYEVLDGVYAFETFSSAAGAGWRRPDEIAAAERIVAGSVVSAGGRAYWRTTMQTVVGYDPEADVSRAVLGPPAAFGGAAWEIGELGGRLCCVSAGREVAEVRVLEDGSEPRWRKVEEFAVEAPAWGDEEGGVVPLRTQSNSETVVWKGQGRVVVARDLSTGKERVLADSAAAGYCADFLPYASSLVHVNRFEARFCRTKASRDGEKWRSLRWRHRRGGTRRGASCR